MDLHLDEYKNKLGDIAIRAIKEKELEKMLLNVQAFWSAAYLTITPYKDKMDFYILGNNEELITKLDDSLETISSILSSRYFLYTAKTVLIILLDMWRVSEER